MRIVHCSCKVAEPTSQLQPIGAAGPTSHFILYELQCLHLTLYRRSCSANILLYTVEAAVPTSHCILYQLQYLHLTVYCRSCSVYISSVSYRTCSAYTSNIYLIGAAVPTSHCVLQDLQRPQRSHMCLTANLLIKGPESDTPLPVFLNKNKSLSTLM